jgi:hypothetical protein
LIDTYAQKTALRLGVSPESCRAEFGKAGHATPVARETPEEEPGLNPETMEPPSQSEFWLLKLLLIHDELAAWTAQHLDLNWLSHPLVRRIVEQRLHTQKNGSWSNLGAFLDHCDSAEMRSLVTECATEDRKMPNPEKQLADIVLKMRNQSLDRQIATVTQKAGLPEISDAERIELLREHTKLRKEKTGPLAAFA